MSVRSYKFKDIARVVTGGTPKKHSENYDGNIPFVTPGDLGEIGVISSTTRTLTRKGADSIRPIPESSVMVCCIGATVGKVGITSKEVATNQQINSLVVDQSIAYPKYVYYFCKTLKDKLMAASSSTTMPIVNKTTFSEFDIPLPPLEEQKRIAAILDKADAIRQKRKQAIELADEFLRSVFLDMFGDPVTNPKGWEVKPLKDGVSKITSGWSAKGESTPCKPNQLGVLKISAVTSGVFKPEENKCVDDALIPAGKKLLFPKKGELLFSRANTRELVGATCIVPVDFDNVFLPDKLWNIELLENQLLPEYLHMLLRDAKFKETLTSQATGSSGSMLNISKQKFEATLAPYPSLELQLKFKSIFWGLLDNATQNDSANEQLNYLFNALSQKAFSGQL